MNKITIQLVIFVIVAIFGYSLAEDSDVLVLDDSNFKQTIDANPLIAVEFYAPWCGHCKSLAPEWEKAATELKGKVPLAKVDCTEEEEICQTYEVQGYPTLKLFRNGDATPLEVARKAEPIIAFMTAELEPAIVILKTQAELDTFLAAHPLAVIGYFDNEHDDRYSTFDQLASKGRHSTSFGAVVVADLTPENKRPSVVFHRNFDEPIVTYSGDITFDALSSWIARQKVPTIGEINGETYQVYVATGLPIGYLFVNPTEDNTDLFSHVKGIAQKVKDHALIAWIDNNKFGQHGVRLGLSGKTVPSFVLDDGNNGKKFLFPETDSISEKLSEWFDTYIAGGHKPHIKSEEIPEDNSGPVKTIVAHTFDSIVKDSSKDVLVEFYAPWCGHCKKLVPIWEELGESFKDTPNVVIAKIDATANDVPPQLNIRGFPTIMLFTAADKEQPVEYQGSRSLEDLKSFVKKHTSGEDEAEEETEEEAEEEAELAEDDIHDEL